MSATQCLRKSLCALPILRYHTTHSLFIYSKVICRCASYALLMRFVRVADGHRQRCWCASANKNERLKLLYRCQVPRNSKCSHRISPNIILSASVCRTPHTWHGKSYAVSAIKRKSFIMLWHIGGQWQVKTGKYILGDSVLPPSEDMIFLLFREHELPCNYPQIPVHRYCYR